MSSSTADVAAVPPDRSRARLAWSLFAGSIGATAIGLVLSLTAWRVSDAFAVTVGVSDVVLLLVSVMFSVVGVLIASRRPENSIGWLLLGIGVANGLSNVAGGYAEWAIYAGSDAPWGEAIAAFLGWTWIPSVALPATFLPLLFPDGHLPSPRWRWFAWVLAIGMVSASIGIIFTGGEIEGYPGVDNPIAVPGFEVLTVGLFVIPIGVIGAVASLVVRFRRAQADERQQIKWVAAAAAVMGVVYTAALLATWISASGWESGSDTPGWIQALQTASIASFALIPLAMGVAILRYHLYDLGLVIRKTLLIAMLALFVTAIYVMIVTGVGAIVGATGSPVLSAVAAAVVALAFQPARRSATRFADRLVYGDRATPYELLSAFSDRVGETYDAQSVLPRMARTVGDGIGADRTEVWVRAGDGLRVSASWPADQLGRITERVRLPDDEASLTLPGADAVYPIEDRGEVLGALAVAMPANDPMDPGKDALVRDLAGQAGLIMRNVRLTADLQARLDDLRAAQKRLVAAQDEERRRLERNIHDGAQQQLVALQVRLRLAAQLVDRDPAKATAMLTDLQAEAATALDELRDLARGIYPPLLADQGLAAALDAQARRAPLPVTVDADGIERLPRAVEAAVYFSALEALQNTAKYAAAERAWVTIERDGDILRFAVGDDGRGFDPSARGYGSGLQGIADRLEALDGALAVESAPGAGTTVRGQVPITTEPVRELGSPGDVGSARPESVTGAAP
ncbi:MAG: sensor histidine kinase [Actinomycetota bacterium]